MFTGIIQSIGRIHEYEARGADARMVIAGGGLDFSDVGVGDSIAVNGVCLTVVSHRPGEFDVDVSTETLSCTQGLDGPGPVNLEKALRLSDRLGGHLVTGHVDGVGEVTHFERDGECRRLGLRVPHPISKYIAQKGSVAVNGVSLTVNRVHGDEFEVNLIPHTLEETNLKSLARGSKVNIEVDLIARYLERMASHES